VWVLANNEANPEVTGAFAVPIPIELAGLPKGTVLYGPGPGTLTLKIQAPQATWARLKPSTFRAYVDLSSGSAGAQDVEIKVDSLESRVRILERIPPTVTLRVEQVIQRSVPVIARSMDDAPDGYVVQPLRTTPAQVSLVGPAPLADSVAEAYVEVRVEGSKVSFSRSYQVVLRDARGREVKGLEQAPTSVVVDVPIERLANYKTVSVKAVITGVVSTGYWISGIVVQPAAVTFGGDPQILQNLSYVETAPVDVSGAVTEVIKSVAVTVPSGAALDKKEEIFVKVSVQPIPGSGLVRRPVAIVNAARGLTVTLASSIVDVLLDASVPALLGLRATDIVPSVDVTGLLTGSYTLPISVTVVPTGTRVLTVTPGRIGVTIR
jgi:YbbR domain-containing protein